MVKECAKLLEDKRSIFKKYWNRFTEHKESINALATLALVLVSIVLVLVTIYSAIVAMKLGNIELYLAAEKEKQKTVEQITLAENLLLEISQNKNIILDSISNLEELKNRTEFQPDLLRTTRIQQAKEMIGFGSMNIRVKLDNYLDAINLIKDDLAEIKKASANEDYKIKRERIDHAIGISNKLINGSVVNVKIDDFVGDIEDYIKERKEHYDEIDKEMEDKLLKLIG